MPSLQCWFQSREGVKIRGLIQCCRIILCWEIIDQNGPVCWSIVVEEKATDVSPFFGAFPSDHIPKATKEINVQKFSSCTSPFKSHQRIPGKSWKSYMLMEVFAGKILPYVCLWHSYRCKKNDILLRFRRMPVGVQTIFHPAIWLKRWQYLSSNREVLGSNIYWDAE